MGVRGTWADVLCTCRCRGTTELPRVILVHPFAAWCSHPAEGWTLGRDMRVTVSCTVVDGRLLCPSWDLGGGRQGREGPVHVGTRAPRLRPATQGELSGARGRAGELRPFAGVQSALGGVGLAGVGHVPCL